MRSDSLGGFLEKNVTALKRIRPVKRGICGVVRVGLMLVRMRGFLKKNVRVRLVMRGSGICRIVRAGSIVIGLGWGGISVKLGDGLLQ